MTRNLKALGLALFAMFAMSAVVASAASAHTPPRFTAPAEATIRAEKDVVDTFFTVTGLETFCETVSFHGVGPAAVSSENQTITPTYTNCKAESIIGTVEVKVTGFGHYGEADKGCDYRLRADEKADLVCETGKEVTVDAGTCVIHIPPQVGLGTITYTTGLRTGNVHDLTVHIDLTSITTNHTDPIGCPLPSGGESATGTLVGTTTVWAEKPAGVAVDLTWHPTVA